MARPYLAFILIAVAAGILFLVTKVAPAPHLTAESVAPGTIRYTFPVGLYVDTGIASLLLFAAAFLFATSRGLLIRLFSCLPFLFGLLLAAASYDAAVSSVTITPTSLTLPARGFPFHPTPTVSFANVAGVMLYANERELRFIQSDGTTLAIPLGDLVTAALPNIFRALDAHHVPYVTID